MNSLPCEKFVGDVVGLRRGVPVAAQTVRVDVTACRRPLSLIPTRPWALRWIF